jgi:hypothetical protein
MEVTWEKNGHGEDVKITTFSNGDKVRELVSKGEIPQIPGPPTEFEQIMAMLKEILDLMKAQNSKPPLALGGK